MAVEDSMCTLVPYFEVADGELEAFKVLGEKMVEATRSESACLFYGFTFNGNRVLCREGYTGAEGVLAHLDNVGPILQEALKIARLDLLEVHGPATELDKLREPMAAMKPVFYTLELGFRNT